MDNNEEDDSDGEHVDILTLVLLAFLDFGCHVGHGSTVGLKSIDVLVASESEVGQFQVEVVIDEDVLKLQVSVHYFAAVHVLDRVKHLVEEKPASIFTHGAHCLAEVEEETALHELHDDEYEVLNDAARWFIDPAGISILVHIDDSLVLKVLQNGNFVMNRNDRVLITAEEFFLQNLDSSVLLSSDELAEINFAGVALTEGLDDLISIIEDRMSLWDSRLALHCLLSFSGKFCSLLL